MGTGDTRYALAEDVLDHDNGLLYNVVDLGVDQVQQDVHASLGGGLDLDGASANGAHGLAHEVNVDFRGVPVAGGVRTRRSAR